MSTRGSPERRRSIDPSCCLPLSLPPPATIAGERAHYRGCSTRSTRPPTGRLRHVRPGHCPVVERFVEDLLVDAALACDLAERTSRRCRLFDDLGRRVVPDVRIERGCGGQSELRIPLARLAVRLDPVDAFLGEETRRRSQQL